MASNEWVNVDQVDHQNVRLHDEDVDGCVNNDDADRLGIVEEAPNNHVHGGDTIHHSGGSDEDEDELSDEELCDDEDESKEQEHVVEYEEHSPISDRLSFNGAEDELAKAMEAHHYPSSADDYLDEDESDPEYRTHDHVHSSHETIKEAEKRSVSLLVWSYDKHEHEHLLQTIQQELIKIQWKHHGEKYFKALEVDESYEKVTFVLDQIDQPQNFKFCVCVFTQEDLRQLETVCRKIQGEISGASVLHPVVLGTMKSSATSDLIMSTMRETIPGVQSIASPIMAIDYASIVKPLCLALESCAMKHSLDIKLTHESFFKEKSELHPCPRDLSMAEDLKSAIPTMREMKESIPTVFEMKQSIPSWIELKCSMRTLLVLFAVLFVLFETRGISESGWLTLGPVFVLCILIFARVPLYQLRVLMVIGILYQLALLRHIDELENDLEKMKSRLTLAEKTQDELASSKAVTNTLTRFLTETLDACGWWCEEIKADMGHNHGLWFEQPEEDPPFIVFVGNDKNPTSAVESDPL